MIFVFVLCLCFVRLASANFLCKDPLTRNHPNLRFDSESALRRQCPPKWEYRPTVQQCCREKGAEAREADEGLLDEFYFIPRENTAEAVPPYCKRKFGNECPSTRGPATNQRVANREGYRLCPSSLTTVRQNAAEANPVSWICCRVSEELLNFVARSINPQSARRIAAEESVNLGTEQNVQRSLDETELEIARGMGVPLVMSHIESRKMFASPLGVFGGVEGKADQLSLKKVVDQLTEQEKRRLAREAHLTQRQRRFLADAIVHRGEAIGALVGVENVLVHVSEHLYRLELHALFTREGHPVVDVVLDEEGAKHAKLLGIPLERGGRLNLAYVAEHMMGEEDRAELTLNAQEAIPGLDRFGVDWTEERVRAMAKAREVLDDKVVAVLREMGIPLVRGDADRPAMVDALLLVHLMSALKRDRHRGALDKFTAEEGLTSGQLHFLAEAIALFGRVLHCPDEKQPLFVHRKNGRVKINAAALFAQNGQPAIEVPLGAHEAAHKSEAAALGLPVGRDGKLDLDFALLQMANVQDLDKLVVDGQTLRQRKVCLSDTQKRFLVEVLASSAEVQIGERDDGTREFVDRNHRPMGSLSLGDGHHRERAARLGLPFSGEGRLDLRCAIEYLANGEDRAHLAQAIGKRRRQGLERGQEPAELKRADRHPTHGAVGPPGSGNWIQPNPKRRNVTHFEPPKNSQWKDVLRRHTEKHSPGKGESREGEEAVPSEAGKSERKGGQGRNGNEAGGRGAGADGRMDADPSADGNSAFKQRTNGGPAAVRHPTAVLDPVDGRTTSGHLASGLGGQGTDRSDPDSGGGAHTHRQALFGTGRGKTDADESDADDEQKKEWGRNPTNRGMEKNTGLPWGRRNRPKDGRPDAMRRLTLKAPIDSSQEGYSTDGEDQVPGHDEGDGRHPTPHLSPTNERGQKSAEQNGERKRKWEGLYPKHSPPRRRRPNGGYRRRPGLLGRHPSHRFGLRRNGSPPLAERQNVFDRGHTLRHPTNTNRHQDGQQAKRHRTTSQQKGPTGRHPENRQTTADFPHSTERQTTKGDWRKPRTKDGRRPTDRLIEAPEHLGEGYKRDPTVGRPTGRKSTERRATDWRSPGTKGGAAERHKTEQHSLESDSREGPQFGGRRNSGQRHSSKSRLIKADETSQESDGHENARRRLFSRRQQTGRQPTEEGADWHNPRRKATAAERHKTERSPSELSSGERQNSKGRPTQKIHGENEHSHPETKWHGIGRESHRDFSGSSSAESNGKLPVSSRSTEDDDWGSPHGRRGLRVGQNHSHGHPPENRHQGGHRSRTKSRKIGRESDEDPPTSSSSEVEEALHHPLVQTRRRLGRHSAGNSDEQKQPHDRPEPPLGRVPTRQPDQPIRHATNRQPYELGQPKDRPIRDAVEPSTDGRATTTKHNRGPALNENRQDAFSMPPIDHNGSSANGSNESESQYSELDSTREYSTDHSTETVDSSSAEGGNATRGHEHLERGQEQPRSSMERRPSFRQRHSTPRSRPKEFRGKNHYRQLREGIPQEGSTGERTRPKMPNPHQMESGRRKEVPKRGTKSRNRNNTGLDSGGTGARQPPQMPFRLKGTIHSVPVFFFHSVEAIDFVKRLTHIGASSGRVEKFKRDNKEFLKFVRKLIEIEGFTGKSEFLLLHRVHSVALGMVEALREMVRQIRDIEAQKRNSALGQGLRKLGNWVNSRRDSGQSWRNLERALAALDALGHGLSARMAKMARERERKHPGGKTEQKVDKLVRGPKLPYNKFIRVEHPLEARDRAQLVRHCLH